MKKHGFLFLLICFSVVFLFPYQSAQAQAAKILLQKQAEAEKAAQKAAEPPPVVDVNKTGVITVTRDEQGEVSEIKLVVLSYKIAMDEKTKLLAGLEGKKVKVTGQFEGEMSDRDERLFKVKNFEPLEQ